MIRVLLADDETLLRALLASLLTVEPDIDVVGQAGDGAEAVALADRLQPDVVVMDVRMPVLDGVEATRQLLGPEGGRVACAVLVLTTYHVSQAVYAALRAGASGFLLKDTAPEDLVSAVRAVARGEGWLHPAVTPELIREFAARPVERVTPDDLRTLSDRETEVLVHLAHGLNNAEIAQRLVVSPATVKTHVSRILLKLDLRDRAQAVAAAYRTGLVRPGELPPI